MEESVLGRITFVVGSEEIYGVHTGYDGDEFGGRGPFIDFYGETSIYRYYIKTHIWYACKYDNSKNGYYGYVEDGATMHGVRQVTIFDCLYYDCKAECKHTEPVNELKSCMEANEPTKEWYKSRIKDLEAELAMARVSLKVTTEKLVSSGVVAG